MRVRPSFKNEEFSQEEVLGKFEGYPGLNVYIMAYHIHGRSDCWIVSTDDPAVAREIAETISWHRVQPFPWHSALFPEKKIWSFLAEDALEEIVRALEFLGDPPLRPEPSRLLELT